MEELVNRSINGDKAAFTELIHIIQSDLFRIAKTRLDNIEDVNDAIQETMIIAYKSMKTLKNPQFFKTWIIKILINKCNKIYMMSQKNSFIEYDENVINVEFNDEEKIVSNMDFYNIIKNLNYKERITFTLYYVEGLTTKEISKILKEPESTVRNRKARAVGKLKNIFEGGVLNEG